MRRVIWAIPLVLSAFLASCVRSASSPLVESAPGAVTATIFPAITPTIIPAEFPLDLGSTWIYDYSAYTAASEAIWNVTVTIVAVTIRDGFLIAEVEQAAILKAGDASSHLLNEPMVGHFWYLFDGGHLYKQSEEPDPAHAADAWLELVFPLGGSGCWFPDARQRSEMNGVTPASGPVPGCRSASGEPHPVEVPAGKFEACIDVVTYYNSGPTFLTFCPGVGIVATRYDHSGSQFGYHSALTGYLLPASNGGTP